jgi:hypothetical protein
MVEAAAAMMEAMAEAKATVAEAEATTKATAETTKATAKMAMVGEAEDARGLEGVRIVEGVEYWGCANEWTMGLFGARAG